MKKILFFDTETTGLPQNYGAPITDINNWPRLVELGAFLYEDGKEIDGLNCIIKPEGYIIPSGASDVHGITTERALKEGFEIADVMTEFNKLVSECDIIVGHNINFDRKIMGAENIRHDGVDHLHGKPRVCTMMNSTSFVKAPKKPNKYGKVYPGYKWPTLQELHVKLFDKEFEGAHGAEDDIRATAKCYFKLRELQVITDQKVFEEVSKVWDDELNKFFLPKKLEFTKEAINGL